MGYKSCAPIPEGRAGLKPIVPIVPNWARAGVIYSRLFKHTQQRTVVLQRTSLGPAPSNASLI